MDGDLEQGDRGSVGRPRPTRGQAREALLHAGREALMDLEPANLISGIGVREITRRAQVSVATFFHHFPTVADYATALVAHVYDADRRPIDATATAGLLRVLEARLPVDQAYAFFGHELERLSSDPEFRLRVGLWALGGSTVDRAYGEFLTEVDDRVTSGASELFRSWGRELRVPFDIATMLAIQTALLQGAATRHLVDPSRLSVENYQRLATALTFVQLRLPGDRHSIDDRLSEINYYPLVHARAQRSGNSRPATRVRILDAAAGLFGLHGYDATSIAQIARRASLSAATVYSTFRSKARIAIALFEAHAADHLVDLAARPGEDPEAALGRLLRGLAELAATRPDTAPQYLLALQAGDAVDGSDPIRPAVSQLIRQLDEAGLLREAVEIDEVSDLLVIAVLRRILTRPADGVEAAAAAATSLILDGARLH